MINELDTVVLSFDVEEFGLKAGDVDSAVHVYKDNAAYEVEFITEARETYFSNLSNLVSNFTRFVN